MTRKEFSTEFDVAFDNLSVNNSSTPSLTEYEKSVFLTQAQDELVKNYFNPRGNKYGEGIGDSDKRDSDFSELVRTITTSASTSVLGGLDDRLIRFSIKDDVFVIINESASYTLDGSIVKTVVKPLSVIEYYKLSYKVYFEPPRRVSWRMITNSSPKISLENIDEVNVKVNNVPTPFGTSDDLGLKSLLSIIPCATSNNAIDFNDSVDYVLDSIDNYSGGNVSDIKSALNQIPAMPTESDVYATSVEIIPHSRATGVEYACRYIKRPNPIILENIGSLTISGISTISECELNPIIHREILNRAVILAKKSLGFDINADVQLDQRSE